ncbi:MAG: hypothetical protein DRP66_07945 [Planctomycetota bacterium]|nr:MAG: hypothetical protein DRP66_07945 [Planctomycetota bacterium]
MFGSKEIEEFAGKLLSQDRVPADEQSRHNEKLFKKIERSILRGKIIGGAIYIVLFSASFAAFQRAGSTVNLVHSACWSAVSIHILLWFLIYFLRVIYWILAEMVDKTSDEKQIRERKNTDRFVTVMAIVVFAYQTFFLYRSFFLNDPSRVSDLAAHIFWGTVFFIFWYPFGTASVAAKLWLEHKKMELTLAWDEGGSDTTPSNRKS